MTHDAPAGPSGEPLIDAPAALVELGAKSRTTLERLIDAGKLTVYRAELNPRKRWFDPAEVRALREPKPTQ